MDRRQFRPSSRNSYGEKLSKFAAHVGADTLVANIDAKACRSFIDLQRGKSPATVNLYCTVLSSFFKAMALDEVVDRNPMDKVRRPKNVAPADRKRTRVTSQQVELMLGEARTWPEKLCLNTLALTGVRRTALSNARWGDVDGKRWLITFNEKGRKRISKPVPLELRRLYTRYWIEQGPVAADDWLVPNKRDTGRRDARSNKIVYSLVKDVARRVGVNCHVHALRAAFAVRFLTSNPAHLESLRQLMGHSSIATTQQYLSEMEGEAAMRRVESLSYKIAEEATA